ncbi:TIR-like protein FxsC [Spirillospora sp. CA-294931]|uniref:TIR-like protein FxsC n=1 Tax=Spirillospora sp. CA-294931 TaxID=3240042 RepID=UPI003D8F2CA6
MTAEYRGSPLFFLSYAHPTSSGGQRGLAAVTEFFTELSMLVADRAGLRAGEIPGFMDSSIEAGRQWNRELRRAVGTCKVFVALLSPNYFTSEWCGREWCAFARRRVTGAVGSDTAIVPVVWTPFMEDQMPSLVKDPQHFMPQDPVRVQVAESYVEYGLNGMHYSGDSNYQTVLWKLAGCIAKIAYDCEVEPLILESTELYNGFEEG